MFLPGYLKSRVEQFYSDLLGLLITGDNKRTSRWEILHRKITRPWKGKLLGLGGSPSFRALLAPRISRGHFFLANFFRVTHDGLSERGTTRSLNRKWHSSLRGSGQNGVSFKRICWRMFWFWSSVCFLSWRIGVKVRAKGGCFSFTRKEKMFWRFFQLVLARVSNILVSKFRFGEGNGWKLRWLFFRQTFLPCNCAAT